MEKGQLGARKHGIDCEGFFMSLRGKKVRYGAAVSHVWVVDTQPGQGDFLFVRMDKVQGVGRFLSRASLFWGQIWAEFQSLCFAG